MFHSFKRRGKKTKFSIFLSLLFSGLPIYFKNLQSTMQCLYSCLNDIFSILLVNNLPQWKIMKPFRIKVFHTGQIRFYMLHSLMFAHQDNISVLLSNILLLKLTTSKKSFTVQAPDGMIFQQLICNCLFQLNRRWHHQLKLKI